VITFSRSIFLVLVCLLVSSCSRSSSTNQTPSQATPSQPARFLLLVAPKLLPDDCEQSEPCTGTPYVRAPYADWTKEGEYNSFEECARAINAPKSDPNAELHRQGKLSKEELLVGFRCVPTTDPRLTSQSPYNWEAEAQADK
jgi:hypothetical protein